MVLARRAFLIALTLAPASRRLGAMAPASSAADRAVEIEWHIFFVTNQQRMRENVRQLEKSERLAAVARRHSRDMLARGYFDHRTPEGATAADRLKQEGLDYGISGENIYSVRNGTTDAAQVAGQMVTGWMDTRGHRHNILDPDYTLLGVGVAVADTLVIATQVFAG